MSTELGDFILEDLDDYCGWCGGEGVLPNDCFEDTCCCADPDEEHGYRTCEYCKGKG